jgi:DNA-binding transcriptional MerR regulator
VPRRKAGYFALKYATSPPSTAHTLRRRCQDWRAPPLDLEVDSKLYRVRREGPHRVRPRSRGGHFAAHHPLLRAFRAAPYSSPQQSGYRVYDPKLADRLRFIRGAKRVGLRLDDIAELLEVMDRGQCPCGHTDGLLRRRLAEINEEIAELAGVRDELTRILDSHPPAACADGTAETWWCRDELAERR